MQRVVEPVDIVCGGHASCPGKGVQREIPAATESDVDTARGLRQDANGVRGHRRIDVDTAWGLRQDANGLRNGATCGPAKEPLGAFARNS